LINIYVDILIHLCKYPFVAALDYKRTLDQLRQRYRDLYVQRRALKAEMISLIKTIEGLSVLCNETPGIVPPEEILEGDAAKRMAKSWLQYMPFVDAIRTALRIIYPTAFTTSELRELLKRAGYPIESKSDPMVALNVALKRFFDAGEVEIVTKGQWRKAYRWAFKNEMAPPPSPLETINWEAVVRDADRSGDDISEEHPLRDALRPREATTAKKTVVPPSLPPGLPNPFGKTLGEMLTEPKKK
jgi:hypothetical protein